jgi:flagellar basal-body rod protein FlgB
MMNRLGDSLAFQAQALALRSERQRLLASNIANADTPGYAARDIDFAGALREATGALNPRSAASSALARLNLPLASGGVGEAHLRYATPSQSNLDGNSVDMDRERASYADTAVKYEATLRFINSHVRMMLDAMKGHNG